MEGTHRSSRLTLLTLLALALAIGSCVGSAGDDPRFVRFEPGQSRRAQQVRAPRRFAFVLVDLGKGVNLEATSARRELLGSGSADRSVREYFVEASYGRQDVVSEVAGPLPYTMKGCDVFGLARDLRPQLAGEFEHYFWYLGSRVPDCLWSALGQSGTLDAPAIDSWYNATTSCTDYIQETGHNLGLQHSNYMPCGKAQFDDDPQRNCTNSEYGDAYDPLGNGCRHFNGFQKALLGWITGCNLIEVTSSGSYTLLPLELACHGPQVLMVPMPKKRRFARSPEAVTELTHYYLEYRSSRGFDSGLRPAVQIRVSGDVRRRDRPLGTWILDMDPSTPAPDGLRAGASFSDPVGGVTIHVDDLDPTRALIRVTIEGGYGAPACLDGSPYTEVEAGPAACDWTPTAPSNPRLDAAPDERPDLASAPARDGNTEESRTGARLDGGPPETIGGGTDACGCHLDGPRSGGRRTAWAMLAILLAVGRRRARHRPTAGSTISRSWRPLPPSHG